MKSNRDHVMEILKSYSDQGDCKKPWAEIKAQVLAASDEEIDATLAHFLKN